MGKINRVADLIDEKALYVEVKEVEEEFDSVLVTPTETGFAKEFSMMKGIFSTITRETGMVLSAIDGSAGDEDDYLLWFSEPEIGVRNLP